MMNIYINEQQLDTKLDGETNLGQVFDQIQKWIESNGKYLRHFTVNGKELNRSDLDSVGIEDTERLDLYVGEELDVIEDSLVEVDNYVDKVGSTLVGRDSLTEKEAEDLKEGIPWIISMIRTTTKLLNLNLNLIQPMGKGKNVEEILESLNSGSLALDSTKAIESFLEDLRDVKLFLMDLSTRLAVMRLDESELIEIISKFVDQKDKVIKDFMLVNENFQSGKDHLASEILNDAVGRLTGLMSALVSIQTRHTELNWQELSFEDKKLSDLVGQLNTTLSNIASAMEKNDIVYAGDILEYELPEILESLVPFLSLVLEKVTV
ncbi:hypothetical protein EHQ75_13825 [Leptospira levettii]|uniref:Ubiquitin-like domain-containing protein n=1 Tax=Leptospira levettii TaxID=2023178 RepID=A0ABY2MR39_9LEPT|nr:hypothetical protein [Leptospira levettii]PKA28373.1 hypothetical protein CH381_00800 [Leptospira sp. mixed culture ATI2-C-A1]MCW7473737.1 hypothetical protein [Leptospira levettii]TGK98685.1 hypothetical protein EHQ34_10520 [Leptospira levettii]TGL73302.1 hypothetical protein EHQ60_04365 [Leptospira levettii]TGM29234.1 hypothetical protein EHQ74_07860 [Leptospira levettii]